jgi:predicted alpha/beta superfamily hydrolase
VIERFTATITPLARSRTIRVYLPPRYRGGIRRYPTLYMHDGQNLFGDGDAPEGIDWGIAAHLDAHGPELIVVGIDSPRDLMRFDELGPWASDEVAREYWESGRTGVGGQGRAYVDWIRYELKPLIDRRYRTAARTAMAGSSMGGLISLYAGCVHPDVFPRVAAVSSAFWFSQREIEEFVRTVDVAAIERLWLDVGTAEASGTVAGAECYVRSNLAVHELLAGRVERLHFEIVEGGEHHESAWRLRFPRIVSFLFAEP